MNVGVAHNRLPPSTSATEMASSERVLGCPTLKSKWVPMFGPMVVSASLTSKRNISSFFHSRLQSRSSWRCRCRHSRLQSRSSWPCRCRPPEVLKSSFCQIPSTGTLFRYQFLFPSTGTRLAADLLYPSRKRFPLRDLAAAQPLVAYETYKSMECEPAESSIGDVGDAPVNSNCDAIALSAAASEHSTGKDTPEAPGWRKRYSSLPNLQLALYVQMTCSCVILRRTVEYSNSAVYHM